MGCIEVDAPGVIFGRFREFSERVRAKFPGTHIVFVLSTRSPDRVARWNWQFPQTRQIVA